MPSNNYYRLRRWTSCKLQGGTHTSPSVSVPTFLAFARTVTPSPSPILPHLPPNHFLHTSSSPHPSPLALLLHSTASPHAMHPPLPRLGHASRLNSTLLIRSFPRCRLLPRLPCVAAAAPLPPLSSLLRSPCICSLLLAILPSYRSSILSRPLWCSVVTTSFGVIRFFPIFEEGYCGWGTTSTRSGPLSQRSRQFCGEY